MNDPTQAIISQKTPAMVFDQSVDWGCPSRDLGGDTIATSTWDAQGTDSALVLSQESIDSTGKITTVWTAGGTLGVFYTITNTITTTDGRTLVGTFIMQIVQYLFLTQPRLV